MGGPSYNYSIMGTKTLFQSLRPLHYDFEASIFGFWDLGFRVLGLRLRAIQVAGLGCSRKGKLSLKGRTPVKVSCNFIEPLKEPL